MKITNKYDKQDRKLQAQHQCKGDVDRKLITRKFGSVYKKCTYCSHHNDGKPCIRTATLSGLCDLFELKTANI